MKKIFVNGYGSIGNRIAKFIKDDPDIDVVGIGKHSSNKKVQHVINDGFSGGEKKRNEILQMITLEPKLAILDETDSGLDIDALQIVAQGINDYRSPDRSFILITHYQRILNYMEPDFVHVLMNGKLVKSGTRELALEVEEKGYSWIEEEMAKAV